MRKPFENWFVLFPNETQANTGFFYVLFLNKKEQQYQKKRHLEGKENFFFFFVNNTQIYGEELSKIMTIKRKKKYKKTKNFTGPH